MAERKRKAVGWGACKRALAQWPRAGVIGLIHELYALSDDNRRFLHARLLPDDAEHALDAAQRKIRQMLSTSSVYNNRFRHVDVKRVIDQFEKATDDPAATAQLLLADLSSTLETFSEVGDYERLADHAYAELERLHRCLEKLPVADGRPLVVSLASLAKRWRDAFGYGVSDELVGLAAFWTARIGADTNSSE